MFETLPDTFTAIVLDRLTRSKYTVTLSTIHDLSEEDFNKEIEKGLSIELAKKA